MELEDECPSPSSPKFDRLSMKSDSPSESLTNGDDRIRMVVTSLLTATTQHDTGVSYRHHQTFRLYSGSLQCQMWRSTVTDDGGKVILRKRTFTNLVIRMCSRRLSKLSDDILTLRHVDVNDNVHCSCNDCPVSWEL